MRILVTGGAGFIGTHFIKNILFDKDYELILNYDNLTYAAHLENHKDWFSLDNYVFINGDICNYIQLNDIVKQYKIDTIINFAAETHVDQQFKRTSAFIHSNIYGVYQLLCLARNNNLRLHHISTDEVFGELPNTEILFDENSKYHPENIYSSTKSAGDFFIQSFMKAFNPKVTISYCTNNYGPLQHREKFIPSSITNLRRGGKIRIYGDGLQVRDWIYVEDHVEILNNILKNGEIGESYCITAKNQMNNLQTSNIIIETMKDMNMLLDISNEKFVEYISDRLGHDRAYGLDNRKIIENGLSKGQFTSFKAGIRKTIQSML